MLSQHTWDTIVSYGICGLGYGLALSYTVSALRTTIDFRKALHWPSVRGRIIESETHYGKGGGKFRLRYEFFVGQEITSSAPQNRGHSHSFRMIIGSTARLSGDWFWTSTQMEEFVNRYPTGQAIEVFYDPKNPKRNCLDREDRRGLAPLWVGAAVATICTSLVSWALIAFP